MGWRSRARRAARAVKSANVKNFNKGLGVINQRAENVRSNPNANPAQRAAGTIARAGSNVTRGTVALAPIRSAQPNREYVQGAANRATDSSNPVRRAAGHITRVAMPGTTGEARVDAALTVGTFGLARGAGPLARAGRSAFPGLARTGRAARRADPPGQTGRRAARSSDDAPRRRFPTGRVATGAVIGTAAIGGFTLLGSDSTSPSPMTATSGSGPSGGSGPDGSEGGMGFGFEDPFLGADAAGFGAGSSAGEGLDLAAIAGSGAVVLGILALFALGDN